MAEPSKFSPFHVLPEPQKLLEIAERIGITVVVAFVIQRLLFLLWGRLAKLAAPRSGDDYASSRRVKTITRVLRNLTTFLVTAFAAIHVLEIMGWDVMPLFAGAGLLGVALGFGAQTLVRDWIAGVFILVENQFDVGDIIELNGRAATVEELKFRSTRLRDANGYVHFVPNGEMKVVTNRSRGWNLLTVDVSVRAGEDLERALDVCREVTSAMSSDAVWKDRMLEPARLWGVERIGADAVIRMVVKGLPGAPTAEAARELRRRVHGALNQAGVRYPHLNAGAPGDTVTATPS
jgi:moderate conductance mechanosensitive channel